MKTANAYFQSITFIGGGNMASALIGSLLRDSYAAKRIFVVEPFEAARKKLHEDFKVNIFENIEAAASVLSDCPLVIWAVKPQVFAQAAQACSAHLRHALHLSVAAGIRSDSMSQWLATERVVRAMPNTPALVGLGMTGLYAREAVSAADKAGIEQIIQLTGKFIWLGDEALLDAVTALSGSGPAYVYYFLEAMTQAGINMGLGEAQAKLLATQTFIGATTLATQSPEPLTVLRERVTSKGGTTYAAITHLQEGQVGQIFEHAMQLAAARAKELGDAFGK